MSSKALIEDAPFTSFHRKLTIYSSGGPFLDGYILSIIGIALSQLSPQLHLSALWSGLIGASALAGIFLGGLVFGYVSDLLGRQALYTIDLIIFIVGSILQFFVSNAVELFILRLIVGIAIGADYPITTALLGEFLPRKQRGPLVGSLFCTWYVGATAAYIVGYLLLGTGPNAWRWMLASSVVPAVIIVLLRFGTPESPRWLLSKGRIDEARQVIHQVFGPEYDIESLGEVQEKTRFTKLFEPGYLGRVLFVGAFYMLQIIPLFAMYTFGPEILAAFHLDKGNASILGSALISLFFLIGVIPAMLLVNKLGRRKLIIFSFLFMTIGLFIDALFPNGSVGVVLAGFLIYALFSGGPNVLDLVYPSELFPTDVRASAVGVTTAISRIGAFVGTFAVPFALTNMGIGTTMYIATGLTFLGLIICVAFAPETKNTTLGESSVVKNSRTGAIASRHSLQQTDILD
ncbi:sugar porter family MFS transporter [Fodinisporobacter ferrooxydans]|uniref:Sugar porter family MFS transporter n=1 Tax=Fodinisporobacter ferrooxydans TaxID=2901836 RepID=A0ABY4CEM3_9BACL|nr:sugar porter family MFS transporter [Alicyclobacillaceae bacterium MYW30-H2]